MLDPKSLYQEIIIDHNRRPKNFGRLAVYTNKAEGNNFLCGDQLTVYLNIVDECIEDVSFDGSGCAISIASASLMTDSIKGKKLSEVLVLFRLFHDLMTGGDQAATADLGLLVVLAVVRDYPTRIKCATLCWHSLKAAQKNAKKNDNVSVSTD